MPNGISHPYQLDETFLNLVAIYKFIQSANHDCSRRQISAIAPNFRTK